MCCGNSSPPRSLYPAYGCGSSSGEWLRTLRSFFRHGSRKINDLGSAIFLSYSSPQASIVERIELALQQAGHSTFRDRSELAPGEAFNARIREAVLACDLLIFLISPESVAAGRYTLTELKFAQDKWPNPSGHVLPVVLAPTPIDTVPEYLRAVTFLQPRGDIAAEVVAEAERLLAPWYWRLRRPRALATMLIIAVLLAGAAWLGNAQWEEARDRDRQATRILEETQDRNRLVTQMLQAGALQQTSGNYASAWDTYARAHVVDLHDQRIIDAQQALAMDWLRNIRGSQLPGGFKAIVEKVEPVLSVGAVSGTGQQAADMMAHLGWADFLLSREGAIGLTPVQHYRKAIELDPNNVYAWAMWGFHSLQNDHSLAVAKEHFARALASGREREYVRHMQFAALLWSGRSEPQLEAIRVANEIRVIKERMPVGLPERPDASRLWDIYYAALINVNRIFRQQFLAALPAADHLATFRWLYPQDKFPRDMYLYHFVLAQLYEAAGERAAASASYRSTLDSLAAMGVKDGSRLLDKTKEALLRLGR